MATTIINHSRLITQLKQYVQLITEAYNTNGTISTRLILAREVMEANRDFLKVLFKSDYLLDADDESCQCEFHEKHDNKDCQTDSETYHYELYSFPHSRWLCTICLVQCYKQKAEKYFP